MRISTELAHETRSDIEHARRRLLTPAVAVTLLGMLHHIDHAIRGNHVGWPLIDRVTPFTFSLGLYLLLVPGIYLTLRGKAWAGYWLITGLVTLALVTWVHFGPSPDAESLPEIYGPYDNAVLGLAAVANLFALIASLVALLVAALRARSASGHW
jgi:hypothetical protein